MTQLKRLEIVVEISRTANTPSQVHLVATFGQVHPGTRPVFGAQRRTLQGSVFGRSIRVVWQRIIH